MVKRLLHGMIVFLVASFVGLNTVTATATVDNVPAKIATIKKKVPLYDRTPRASRSYARGLVITQYGWRMSEYSCLRELWQKESKWNHKADNPNSSAYGIPQMLGMTTKNPQRQIQIGLKYIKHRYGTPCEAWSFWRSHGYY